MVIFLAMIKSLLDTETYTPIASGVVSLLPYLSTPHREPKPKPKPKPKTPHMHALYAVSSRNTTLGDVKEYLGKKIRDTDLHLFGMQVAHDSAYQ